MSIAPQVLLEVVPLRAALVADAHNWVHLAVAVGIDAVDDAGQSTMVERLTDIRVSAKSSVGSRFEYPALATVHCGSPNCPIWISVLTALEPCAYGSARTRSRWPTSAFGSGRCGSSVVGQASSGLGLLSAKWSRSLYLSLRPTAA